MSAEERFTSCRSSLTTNTRRLRVVPNAVLSLCLALVLFAQPHAAQQRPNGIASRTPRTEEPRALGASAADCSQSASTAAEEAPLDNHERGLVRAMAAAIFRDGRVSRETAEQLAEYSIRMTRVDEHNGRLDPLAAEVLAVDRWYQRARVQNDVATIDHMLSAAYTATDKNGDPWDKSQVVTLWSRLAMECIETTRSTVRLSGDNAIVQGRETQVTPSATDHLLFTRVYQRVAPGRWQLLVNTQSRDPHRE